MKFIIRLLMLLAAIVLGYSRSAQAAEFTQSQRSEIEGILRDYLLNNPQVLSDAMKALEQRQRENLAKQSGASDARRKVSRSRYNVIEDGRT